MSHSPSTKGRITTSLLMCLTLSVLTFGSSRAQNSTPEKEELINRLLEQTNQSAEAVGQKMAEQMSAMLNQSAVNIPAEAHDIVRQAVTSIINEEAAENNSLFQIAYPIYDKHFSLEDLRAIVDFYKTPAGKKVLEVMPVLNQEAINASQQWAVSITPKIQERVKQEFKEAGIE